MSSSPQLICTILAAGVGSRMKTNTPKPLLPLAGQPLINHIQQTLIKAGTHHGIVVTHPDFKDIVEVVQPWSCAFQEQRLGTAHALLAAKKSRSRCCSRGGYSPCCTGRFPSYH